MCSNSIYITRLASKVDAFVVGDDLIPACFREKLTIKGDIYCFTHAISKPLECKPGDLVYYGCDHGEGPALIRLDPRDYFAVEGVVYARTPIYQAQLVDDTLPDFLEDIKTMLDLGFTELSMEPVVCAPEDPSALTDEDLPIVLKQYEDLAELMRQRRREGRPFTFYHYMLDLSGGPCIYKRISGCGSGTEYMAVTPWGDLYPCHQFVGEEKFKLGDIWHGVDNTQVQEEFASCNVYARPDCKDCWARLYCSGGCAANAYHATGSVKGVYKYGCELFKKRMECAIMLAVSEEDDGTEEDL